MLSGGAATTNGCVFKTTLDDNGFIALRVGKNATTAMSLLCHA